MGALSRTPTLTTSRQQSFLRIFHRRPGVFIVVLAPRLLRVTFCKCCAVLWLSPQFSPSSVALANSLSVSECSLKMANPQKVCPVPSGFHGCTRRVPVFQSSCIGAHVSEASEASLVALCGLVDQMLQQGSEERGAQTMIHPDP